MKTGFVHVMEHSFPRFRFRGRGALNTFGSEFNGIGSHWLHQGLGRPVGGIQNGPQASMGLATMLLGVSGSCEDMEATSLPVELEPGPPSEKLTSCWKAG